MRLFSVVLLFALLNFAAPVNVKRMARKCLTKIKRFERDCTTKVTGVENIDGCTEFNTTVLKQLIGKRPIKLPNKIWKERQCSNFEKAMKKCEKIKGFELECTRCGETYELRQCGNQCSQPTCKDQGMMCYSWPEPADDGNDDRGDDGNDDIADGGKDGTENEHPNCKAVCRCPGSIRDVSHQGQCHIQEWCRKFWDGN